jgi:hypothetical protein
MMTMIKKLMSNGKVFIFSVILLAAVSAPVVVPVIAPQYACFIPAFERVMNVIGILQADNETEVAAK